MQNGSATCKAWTWSGKVPSYPGTATEAAFLLGGIGTGNVSLGARGELRDWEIMNRPSKGTAFDNTYFTVWTGGHGRTPIARVLESRLNPPFVNSHGLEPRTGGGLPRLKQSVMTGEYPLVGVEFFDDVLPVEVRLEAFTPFIPLNPVDSGLPCAILRYRVKNPTDKPVDVTIVGSLMNPIGYERMDIWKRPAGSYGQHVNEYRQESELQGLYFTSLKFAPDHLAFGNLALTTTYPDVTVKRTWLRAGWFDEVREFWNDFASDGRLTDLNYDSPSPDGKRDTGSLGVYATLLPGGEQVFTFILSWYFPNRPRGWGRPEEGAPKPTIRNHYATLFSDAWDVARYVAKNLHRLEQETLTFHRAFFGSSLPASILEAAAANITVLRSPTCFWLEDGSFMGWEGCFNESGCCHGNCTHVWNYEQTLAFLFPTLERSMRRQELGLETAADGKMDFRVGKVFSPLYRHIKHAAADGQLGSIMQLYRDWKLSGDNQFLAELWPGAERAINYALTFWDTDKDLVLDGQQHNTYDIEFYGPNPLTGLFFVGALKAAARMAQALGEADKAARYDEMSRLAAERLEAATWNGEYYEQRLADVNQYRYQFGRGCLSDQLLAQTSAHLYGLGYLLPPARVRSAIQAVFRHNFRTSFATHVNLQRAYVFNDEQGLLLCSWPHGGCPTQPFVYSDEVWTGIEYHVATHLIYEGFMNEALTVVKAVRDRHDGFKRNPWNEVECGHHYSRAMSSWGLVLAYSGFAFDMTKPQMSFSPQVDGEFQCFWSTGRGWGVYRQRYTPAGALEPEVEVLCGDMTGVTVTACGKTWRL